MAQTLSVPLTSDISDVMPEKNSNSIDHLEKGKQLCIEVRENVSKIEGDKEKIKKLKKKLATRS